MQALTRIHQLFDLRVREAPQQAFLFTPEGEVSARPRTIEVVDTVGAGDAFMAATLAQHGWLRQDPDTERFALGAGAHIVASRAIYGGSHNLLDYTLPRFGVETTFVDPRDLGAVHAQHVQHTFAVLVEASKWTNLASNLSAGCVRVTS